MPLLERLIGVVAPHTCLACGREGKLMCDQCTPDAFITLPSRCFRCKRITLDFAVCDSCKKQVRLRHVWIRTGYEAHAKELLRLYKFERAQAAAGILAQTMCERLPYLSPATLVIPVPTATSRVRARGYDHAALLARAIARERHYTWLRAVTHLSQSRQVGSSRQQRLAQLKNDFIVTKLGFIKGRDILIVDDVVTTGATIETMATVLKQAGAKSVNALAFAQKQ